MLKSIWVRVTSAVRRYFPSCLDLTLLRSSLWDCHFLWNLVFWEA